MTHIEHELLDTLTTLEETIAQMATASPKPDLLPIFSRLDELTAQMPRGAEPDLLHYLHRKSYQKAAAFLRERKSGQL